MHLLPSRTFSAFLAAGAILLSGCGGGTTSSAPVPYVNPWVVEMTANNATAGCTWVAFFLRINGSGWQGPINPDAGYRVKAGESGSTRFTFQSNQTNAQFRIQARFYKATTCTGTATIVQADSQTLYAQSAGITGTLKDKSGRYAIALSTDT
jgi:hypothetical protein